MARVSNRTLEEFIENEGTIDGINVPSALGVHRICLDLRDARERCSAVAKERDNCRVVLDELVHACEDLIDDYGHIQEACKKAKNAITGLL